MSETIDESKGINISINNSDSNSGDSPSFLDRLFDIGLKLIIPLGLILALIAVIIVVRVVLPLVDVVTSIGLPLRFALPGPIGTLVGGLGAAFGWLAGRS